ncbi:hypothetical protein BBP40_003042 [Aspergillus hancockii]|nr:hypothetical protein BBP40_003042 [Aspergillus hancockii]
MHNTLNNNKLLSLPHTPPKLIPIYNRKLLLNPLSPLPQPRLSNLIIPEPLQIPRQPHNPPNPNNPLRNIILIPLSPIPIIGRKLMMEIMKPLPERNNRRQKMIPRRTVIIKRLLAQIMRERINAERSLSGHQTRKQPAHAKGSEEVVPVLPDYDWVIVEIGEVDSGFFASFVGGLPEENPEDVGLM